MLVHGFAITYLPQKLEEHHQPPNRCQCSLGLPQFHFFPAPKRGNFPVHYFVLLGVSSIQLKLNRDRAKQCYSISAFRRNEKGRLIFHAPGNSLGETITDPDDDAWLSPSAAGGNEIGDLCQIQVFSVCRSKLRKSSTTYSQSIQTSITFASLQS